MVIGVIGDHLLEAEPGRPFPRHGHADEALCVGGHEIDVGSGRKLGGADAVAFVLAVLVIGDDDDLAPLQCGDAVFNRIESHLLEPVFPNSDS